MVFKALFSPNAQGLFLLSLCVAFFKVIFFSDNWLGKKSAPQCRNVCFFVIWIDFWDSGSVWDCFFFFCLHITSDWLEKKQRRGNIARRRILLEKKKYFELQSIWDKLRYKAGSYFCCLNAKKSSRVFLTERQKYLEMVVAFLGRFPHSKSLSAQIGLE